MTGNSTTTNSLNFRGTASVLNLGVYLFGVLLGGVVIRLCGVSATVSVNFSFYMVWLQTMKTTGKFLLLLLLLSSLRSGVLWTPVVFSFLGLMHGASVAALAASGSLRQKIGTLAILSGWVLLALPFGFLLGEWSERSSAVSHRQNGLDAAVIISVLLVCTVSALLSASLSTLWTHFFIGV